MNSERPVRRRSRRRVALASGVVGAISLASGLSACGVSAGSASTVESAAMPKVATAAVVRKAAERTREATSVTVRAEVVVTDETNDPVVTSVTEGGFDASTGRGSFEVTADGDLTGLAGKDAVARMVIDRGDLYLQVPGMEVLTDRPWVKVPSAKLGRLGSTLRETTTLHPESLVDVLEGASSKVEELGVEPIDGTSTRHLRVHLDIDKALAKVPAERRKRLQEALDRLGSAADRLRDQPADIWVDGDGYVRRLKITTSLAGLPGASELGRKVTETVDLGGFGEKVDVEVPSADQVEELDPSSLFGN